MRSRLGRHGLAAIGALAATLVVAGPADADRTVRVGGGQTTLRVSDATANRFQALDAGIRMDAPARTRRRDSVIPIGDGRIDPATGRGTVTQVGGFTLMRAAEQIRFRALRIRIGARSTLSARVGGRHLNVLTLAVRGVRRDGLGTVVRPAPARVTRDGARAINRALGVRAVVRGQLFGRIGLTVEPAQVALTGGDTTLALDATTLTQLGVAAVPTAPATAGPAGLLLPVAGGRLAADDLAGTIEHAGGVAFSSGTRTIELTQPTVTFADTPQLGFSYSGAPVAFADLAVAGDVRIDRATRTISATMPAVRLTTAGAELLNRGLGTQAFRPGFALGTAAVAAQAR